MAKFRGSDVVTILKGLNAVSKAATSITEKELKEAWSSSSIRSSLGNVNLNFNTEDLPRQFRETAGRSLAVAKGMSEFSKIIAHQFILVNSKTENISSEIQQDIKNNIEDITAVSSGILISIFKCYKMLYIIV
jgi:hypothetical protein